MTKKVELILVSGTLSLPGITDDNVKMIDEWFEGADPTSKLVLNIIENGQVSTIKVFRKDVVVLKVS